MSKTNWFFAMLCIVCLVILVNPCSQAGDYKSVVLVYGPDKYGVVCYRAARDNASDPISCVQVQEHQP